MTGNPKGQSQFMNHIYSNRAEQASTLPDEVSVRSVSELTAEIRSLLEPVLSGIWTRGEVSNLRRQSSGHTYFTLKDDQSQVSVALFRRAASRLTFELHEGTQIVVFGNISVYAPRGNYQLIAEQVIEDGVGRLQREFERLKRKLAAEGLFDTEKKKSVPTLPGRVLVVTSISGAALQDFLSILRRNRWSGTVALLPVRVQGAEAASEIADALGRAGTEYPGDLVVLCRGGGSLEDLWPFNEEIVARAVAACSIPVISAVGHEIDYTLSDFCADLRCETPSAAAEFLTSAHARLRERFARAGKTFDYQIDTRLTQIRNRLAIQRHQLARHRPSANLQLAWMRLDELSASLVRHLSDVVLRSSRRVDQIESRLMRCDPLPRIKFARERLQSLSLRMENAGPDAAVRRGYVMLSDDAGRIISDLAKWPPETSLTARFRDGSTPIRRAGESTPSEQIP